MPRESDLHPISPQTGSPLRLIPIETKKRKGK